MSKTAWQEENFLFFRNKNFLQKIYKKLIIRKNAPRRLFLKTRRVFLYINIMLDNCQARVVQLPLHKDAYTRVYKASRHLRSVVNNVAK
jgi:hypothetical protein